MLVGGVGDSIVMKAVLLPAGEDLKREVAAACKSLKGRLGKRPDVILMHATPGIEEDVVEGIDASFGGDVAVYGGSAADDTISGEWLVFSGTERLAAGVLLVAIASNEPIYGDFVGGYLPTRHRGTVTAAVGRRLMTIDGQPAAQVYNRWTQGAIADALDGGGSVLSATSMHPIGRVVDRVMGISFWLLSHPHQINPDGSVDLFTDVAVGDDIALMRGSAQALVNRAEQVVTSCLKSVSNPTPKGSILIYCGGCVGAIMDQVQEVAAVYAAATQGAPFIGAATFGEQGCFVGTSKQNRHGNLMSSVVIFG